MLDAKQNGGHADYEVTQARDATPEAKAAAMQRMVARYDAINAKLTQDFQERLGGGAPKASSRAGTSAAGISLDRSSLRVSSASVANPPGGNHSSLNHETASDKSSLSATIEPSASNNLKVDTPSASDINTPSDLFKLRHYQMFATIDFNCFEGVNSRIALPGLGGNPVLKHRKIRRLSDV